jgi:hypothetical protein
MKNKMNEDYLWDKAGEPDSEIQELERVLGTLRYQPRPLVIPEALQLVRQRSSPRNFRPVLAIAATLILVVGAAALWLSFIRQQSPETAKTDTTPAANVNSDRVAATIPDDVLNEISNIAPGKAPVDRNDIAEEPRSPQGRGKPLITPRRNRHNRTSSPANANGNRAFEPQTPELAANELKEAEAGKAKLMLALRVASAKLNFALRKAQGTNNTNLIHNQHKVG